MPYKMHDTRTDAEVRQDATAARGKALEERLLRKMADKAGGTINPYPYAAERFSQTAREAGALEFIGQLDRMAEADRVLQLAWEARVFHEAIWGDRTVPMRLRELDVGPVVEEIKRVAYDLLAEQYADLHVKIRLDAWTDVQRLKQCPARTFGGAEAAVRR
jgi:hypothetical protein